MTSILYISTFDEQLFVSSLFFSFSLSVNLIIFLKAFIDLTIYQLEVSGNCFIFFSNLKKPSDNKKIRLNRK